MDEPKKSLFNDGIKSGDKQKIIAILKALFPGATLYLYGSRARGTNRALSDIDIDEYNHFILMIEDRNQTSHGYDEDVAEEICQRILLHYQTMVAMATKIMTT